MVLLMLDTIMVEIVNMVMMLMGDGDEDGHGSVVSSGCHQA